jgi:DNA-binding NarL/FixJ family response regulator
METTRIIFTDNVPRYRDIIIQDLSLHNIVCISEADNGRELLRLLKSTKPDVVLLDLEMPVMDGNETLDHIMKEHPDTKVIILSMYYEQLLVEDYIRRGARGYIPKDEIAGNIELLVTAIKTVKRGQPFVHHLPVQKQPGLLKYSSMQKQITPMLCHGYTNQEIAEELSMHIRNVEKQRSKIYTKIGGEKAVDFYRYAFSRGLQFLSRNISRKK